MRSIDFSRSSGIGLWYKNLVIAWESRMVLVSETNCDHQNSFRVLNVVLMVKYNYRFIMDRLGEVGFY